MRVLVACEFSGIVRDAFLRAGHDAMSCDLLQTEAPGDHYLGDVADVIDDGWDLMIAHPPCTYLCASGARWWDIRADEQLHAIRFVRMLLNADIPRIAVENPVGLISTIIRKPDQYINPWEYGHGETKKTGLWLKNLPHLRPTEIVHGREPVCHHASGKDRWKFRSRTYHGIADAMSMQWGNL
jgi:hypothetical protein